MFTFITVIHLRGIKPGDKTFYFVGIFVSLEWPFIELCTIFRSSINSSGVNKRIGSLNPKDDT